MFQSISPSNPGEIRMKSINTMKINMKSPFFRLM